MKPRERFTVGVFAMYAGAGLAVVLLSEEAP